MINEITQTQLSSAWDKINKEHKPFKEFFKGDETRILIPMDQELPEEFKEYWDLIQKEGWNLDNSQPGYASKDIKSSFNGEERVQKRTVKIGSLMKKLSSEADSYWNKNSQQVLMQIKDNKPKIIIFTIDKLDLIRTGDFNKYSGQDYYSCLAPGRTYYSDAIDDASYGGGLCILVDKFEFDLLDDQEDGLFKHHEIFDDPERPDLNKLEVLARIKIKRVLNETESIELAVPEKRIYGPLNKTFLQTVQHYFFRSQIGKIQLCNPNDDYVYVGGKYQDNPLDVLGDLIGIPIKKYEHSSGVNQKDLWKTEIEDFLLSDSRFRYGYDLYIGEPILNFVWRKEDFIYLTDKIQIPVKVHMKFYDCKFNLDKYKNEASKRIIGIFSDLIEPIREIKNEEVEAYTTELSSIDSVTNLTINCTFTFDNADKFIEFCNFLEYIPRNFRNFAPTFESRLENLVYYLRSVSKTNFSDLCEYIDISTAESYIDLEFEKQYYKNNSLLAKMHKWILSDIYNSTSNFADALNNFLRDKLKSWTRKYFQVGVQEEKVCIYYVYDIDPMLIHHPKDTQDNIIKNVNFLVKNFDLLCQEFCETHDIPIEDIKADDDGEANDVQEVKSSFVGHFWPIWRHFNNLLSEDSHYFDKAGIPEEPEEVYQHANAVFGDNWRVAFPIISSDDERTMTVMEIASNLQHLGYSVPLDPINFGYAFKEVISNHQGIERKATRKYKLGLLIKKHLSDDLSTWWNKNSEFFIKNKEFFSESSAYMIILSRHPVDCCRMSDHQGWTSCHAATPGSNHFYHAMEEGNNKGVIAYLVSKDKYITEDIEHHLNDHDIFRDPERGVGLKNVYPVARLRLRLYDFKDASNGDLITELLVTEDRIYGIKTPGFKKTIDSYLINKQQEECKAIEEFCLEDITIKWSNIQIYIHGSEYAEEEKSHPLYEFLKKRFPQYIISQGFSPISTGTGDKELNPPDDEFNDEDDQEQLDADARETAEENINAQLSALKQNKPTGRLAGSFNFDVEGGEEDITIQSSYTLLIKFPKISNENISKLEVWKSSDHPDIRRRTRDSGINYSNLEPVSIEELLMEVFNAGTPESIEITNDDSSHTKIKIMYEETHTSTDMFDTFSEKIFECYEANYAEKRNKFLELFFKYNGIHDNRELDSYHLWNQRDLFAFGEFKLNKYSLRENIPSIEKLLPDILQKRELTNKIRSYSNEQGYGARFPFITEGDHLRTLCSIIFNGDANIKNNSLTVADNNLIHGEFVSMIKYKLFTAYYRNYKTMYPDPLMNTWYYKRLGDNDEITNSSEEQMELPFKESESQVIEELNKNIDFSILISPLSQEANEMKITFKIKARTKKVFYFLKFIDTFSHRVMPSVRNIIKNKIKENIGNQEEINQKLFDFYYAKCVKIPQQYSWTAITLDNRSPLELINEEDSI